MIDKIKTGKALVNIIGDFDNYDAGCEMGLDIENNPDLVVNAYKKILGVKRWNEAEKRIDRLAKAESQVWLEEK